MKTGHADPLHMDNAIDTSEKMLAEKKSDWKTKRDENLAKNPYAPPAPNVQMVTDGMTSLFLVPTPQKGAPATPKEEKKKRKKHVEESEDDEEQEEEAVEDDDEVMEEDEDA
jgi:hypothetical protein